jgi:hydrogenase expression/formation protein HypE
LPGDAVIVSGNLGDHHAAILSARLGIKNTIKSDCALLTPIVRALADAKIEIHAMRDVTRGGLGTILNELAAASGVSIEIEEKFIPADPEVRAFCGMMGLDPLYMGNEGKMVLAVAPGDAEHALACIRGTEIGRNAALIGYASEAEREAPEKKPSSSLALVTMRTRVGGTVRIDLMYGEGLPRIC